MGLGLALIGLRVMCDFFKGVDNTAHPRSYLYRDSMATKPMLSGMQCHFTQIGSCAPCYSRSTGLPFDMDYLGETHDMVNSWSSIGSLVSQPVVCTDTVARTSYSTVQYSTVSEVALQDSTCFGSLDRCEHTPTLGYHANTHRCCTIDSDTRASAM